MIILAAVALITIIVTQISRGTYPITATITLCMEKEAKECKAWARMPMARTVVSIPSYVVSNRCQCRSKNVQAPVAPSTPTNATLEE